MSESLAASDCLAGNAGGDTGLLGNDLPIQVFQPLFPTIITPTLQAFPSGHRLTVSPFSAFKRKGNKKDETRQCALLTKCAFFPVILLPGLSHFFHVSLCTPLRFVGFHRQVLHLSA